MSEDNRGFLQRAFDETGVGVRMEALDATMRAAYGDDAVDATLRKVAEQLVEDVRRRVPR